MSFANTKVCGRLLSSFALSDLSLFFGYIYNKRQRNTHCYWLPSSLAALVIRRTPHHMLTNMYCNVRGTPAWCFFDVLEAPITRELACLYPWRHHGGNKKPYQPYSEDVTGVTVLPKVIVALTGVLLAIAGSVGHWSNRKKIIFIQRLINCIGKETKKKDRKGERSWYGTRRETNWETGRNRTNNCCWIRRPDR